MGWDWVWFGDGYGTEMGSDGDVVGMQMGLGWKCI